MSDLTKRDALLNKCDEMTKTLNEIWAELRDMRGEKDFNIMHISKADEFRCDAEIAIRNMHYHIRNIENN